MSRMVKRIVAVVALLCMLGLVRFVNVKAEIDSSVFKQFYPCFYQYNWDTYDDSMKQKLITYLTTAYFQELNVEPAVVEFEDLGIDKYAEYRLESNTIVYNTYYLFSAQDMYKAIAHECRHVWQYSKEDYAQDFENYIPVSASLSRYLTQPIEMDAEAYAEAEYFKLVCYAQQEQALTSQGSDTNTVSE